MSELLPLPGVHTDPVETKVSDVSRDHLPDRRSWTAPSVVQHSTMTTLTQAALPTPLSLLFLQSSIQCRDQDGNPVTPCPPP